MIKQKTCVLCNTEGCLTTLGQYCLCASCRAEILREALEFAKRNTIRGTAYHAAFAHILAEFTEDAENKFEEV